MGGDVMESFRARQRARQLGHAPSDPDADHPDRLECPVCRARGLTASQLGPLFEAVCPGVETDWSNPLDNELSAAAVALIKEFAG
jgi:hypothetical protein